MRRFGFLDDEEIAVLWYALTHDDGVQYGLSPSSVEGRIARELEAEWLARGWDPMDLKSVALDA